MAVLVEPAVTEIAPAADRAAVLAVRAVTSAWFVMSASVPEPEKPAPVMPW